MMWDVNDIEFPEQPVASLSDIDEFLEDHGWRLRSESLSSEDGRDGEGINLEEDEENCISVEEMKQFWEDQRQLLQGALRNSSSTEMRIRDAVKEALKEIRTAEMACGCGRPAATIAGCRNCVMREICVRLQNAGLNVSICKSKWRSSSCMPSGEHTFLDVVDDSSSRRGEIRVIIELNFRAEFEIARACEEYNSLVRRLPEVFVGKVERLQGVIKILCSAAKKCMKEKKMHMAPWRKQRYMQAKWLGSCVRTLPPFSATTALSSGISCEQRKPMASMLTLDLHEKLSDVHRTAVKVV